MAAKTIYVADLHEGLKFDELFLVKSAKLGETRTGKPYLVLTLMDRSGELSGPVWDNAEDVKSRCPAGEVVRVSGLVQSYRDKLQLKIDVVSGIDQAEINPADYFPASPKNLEQMAAELQDLVQSIKNPYIKKLLFFFFKKSDWWVPFQTAPAAKAMHHAYIGGLLEHSLSVAKSADLLAGHYPGIDRSLLLAGALLHDIGKLEELSMENGVVEYTVRGRLKGHLVIGSEMVVQAAQKIKDFPQDTLEQVQHLILSHHGRQEFGSPTVPMTVEAFMLSFLDDLDAKMNITEQLRRKMDGESLEWTDYQRSLERYLYLGGFQEKEIKVAAAKDELEQERAGQPNRQPTLF